MTKKINFGKPENENYAATIVQVRMIRELDNCDNVVAIPTLGYQAIVGKDTKLNTLGVLFTAETQLSEAFAAYNNLYRDNTKNNNPLEKGYLDQNRRVKALKFRGHQSDALFLPLTSLAYLGIDVTKLNEGDTFDAINGNTICQKYYIKQPSVPGANTKNVRKAFSRVDAKFLPEHYATDNYWRNMDKITGLTNVIVTQKLHGTSIRLANTIVKRELKWYERLARKAGLKIQTTEYDHVFGSRRVIKDANNPNQQHFYKEDIWSVVGKDYQDQIPENFVLFGEVVGYTKSGEPIQKNYTYDLKPGNYRLYIYRVAVITNSGQLVDLSWDAVKEFCWMQGFHHVPELWRGAHDEFYANDWINKRYDEEFLHAVPMSGSKKLVDEGVCVRVEGLAPYILKAKSPIFLQHESAMLDAEVVDLESLEAV